MDGCVRDYVYRTRSEVLLAGDDGLRGLILYAARVRGRSHGVPKADAVLNWDCGGDVLSYGDLSVFFELLIDNRPQIRILHGLICLCESQGRTREAGS